MVMVDNPLGLDPMDFNDSTAADRVGRRIKEIRDSIGMTQAELGEKIGLNGDRIQKYENGARRPKSELLKSIASALGVETLALTDPVVSNCLGAMYAFFEMEGLYDLKVRRVDGKITLMFGNGFMGSMNSYLDEWEKECRQVNVELEDASTEEERSSILHQYDMWKWTFPRAITDKTEKDLRELRRAKIEEQIRQLQKELSNLRDDDVDYEVKRDVK
jgi:transcriptional regulator with XRE-family HTH domain